MTTTRWKVEIKGNTATVLDEHGSFVGPLVDLELGWTDTQTGNYVDPDAEAAILHQIVREHNAHAALVEFIESFLHAQKLGIEPTATVDRIDKAQAALRLAKGE